ncbi:MAG: amidohydrolase family protein [Deltaproteobacteria bacterium]|nr:amidohydrolase family protein [Deltaproteobacteria bacterium]
MARLVIDAHTHAQRFTPGFNKRGEPFTYKGLENVIMSDQPFDNSRLLLADMDRLNVDMSVLLSAFNMRNEMIEAQVKRYPDRFIAFCCYVETSRREWTHEAPFDAEEAAAEVDFWLSRGFVGVGETTGMLPSKNLDMTIEENVRLLWPILEVATKHEAPVLFHTGCIAYPDTCRLRGVDPILVDDIALAFPKIPIILGHAGVQTGWYRNFPENAAMVAGRHPNVYLELSQCQAGQIERVLHDPNIGPDKLLFGSDWGVSISYQPYGKGNIYAATPPENPPNTLPMHMDWNLRQIYAIEMSEEDRAKILGLNMAKICKLDIKAIMARKEDRYGDRISWNEIDTYWEPSNVGRENSDNR